MDFTYRDEDHSYWVEGVKIPSVTQVISSMGFSDFSKVNPEKLEWASNRGKAVHETCRLFDMGILDFTTVGLEIIPYLNAWKKFKEGFNVELLPEWIENRSVCEKYRFGFCTDRVAKIYNKFGVIDLKTSETPSPVAGLQTSGYKIGVEQETKLKIQFRWAIHLGSDGNFKLQEYTDPAEESIFLMALQCHNWKERKLIKTK